MSNERTFRRSLVRIEGHRHARSLTFSCFQRRPFFRSARACEWFVDALQLARQRHPIDLWAWVVMPTHAHVLVYPTVLTPTIGRFLFTVKQSVAKRAIGWTREHAPDRLALFEDRSAERRVVFRFWQRGAGYDRNLANPEAIRLEIAYIHRNPVQAGLCARAEEWNWSSAREHAQQGSGPIKIDRDSLGISLA